MRSRIPDMATLLRREGSLQDRGKAVADSAAQLSQHGSVGVQNDEILRAKRCIAHIHTETFFMKIRNLNGDVSGGQLTHVDRCVLVREVEGEVGEIYDDSETLHHLDRQKQRNLTFNHRCFEHSVHPSDSYGNVHYSMNFGRTSNPFC